MWVPAGQEPLHPAGILSLGLSSHVLTADSTSTENFLQGTCCTPGRTRNQDQGRSDSDKALREKEAVSRQRGPGLPRGTGDRGALAPTEGRARPRWERPQCRGSKEQCAQPARERASAASGAGEKPPQRPKETREAGVLASGPGAGSGKRQRAGTSSKRHQRLGPGLWVG